MKPMNISNIYHMKILAHNGWKSLSNLEVTILGFLTKECIFTSVFHRILDFKSGVEFLFRPFFYFMPVMPDNIRGAAYSKTNSSVNRT